MKRTFLHFIFVFFAVSSVFAQVNITFELNAASLNNNIDPGGLFVAGGSGFGVPGDNQLLDGDGDGIYTITLQRDAGFSSHYTFLNGNCGDWSCKENIAGLPCSDPDNFNDRFLPPVTQDTTVKACFGTCDSDGTCTIVTDSVDITFTLNTASIEGSVDPTGMFIAGGGNFGDPGDYPMDDSDGDGTWTITVRKPMGFSSFYTFTNGNSGWGAKEDLTGLPCGDPDNFNDRFLPETNSDMTVMACFGACDTDGTCASVVNVNNLKIDETLFSLQPSLVSNFTNITFGENAINQEKQILVMNAVGQVVYTTETRSETTFRINAADYTSGLYFISVKTEKAMLTKKIVVYR